MTSTTRNILIGLALGVATGLFLGEKAGVFQLVAEGYLGKWIDLQQKNGTMQALYDH